MNDPFEDTPKPPVDHQESPASGGAATKDERMWATFAHLSSLLGLLGAGMLGFLGPLIIWLMKRDESSFVDDQGKEAVNFQITLLIGFAAALIITIATCGVAFPVMFIPGVVQIVFAIIAAIQANDGNYYRYPFNIRMIK